MTTQTVEKQNLRKTVSPLMASFILFHLKSSIINVMSYTPKIFFLSAETGQKMFLKKVYILD